MSEFFDITKQQNQEKLKRITDEVNKEIPNATIIFSKNQNGDIMQWAAVNLEGKAFISGHSKSGDLTIINGIDRYVKANHIENEKKLAISEIEVSDLKTSMKMLVLVLSVLVILCASLMYHNSDKSGQIEKLKQKLNSDSLMYNIKPDTLTLKIQDL